MSSIKLFWSPDAYVWLQNQTHVCTFMHVYAHNAHSFSKDVLKQTVLIAWCMCVCVSADNRMDQNCKLEGVHRRWQPQCSRSESVLVLADNTGILIIMRAAKWLPTVYSTSILLENRWKTWNRPLNYYENGSSDCSAFWVVIIDTGIVGCSILSRYAWPWLSSCCRAARHVCMQ